MSLSRKNSSDDIVEHKNPLFMRKTNSSTKQEEVSHLMHNLQVRAQMQDPAVAMARSRSALNASAGLPSPNSASKAHVNPLSRLSMKMKNRKSMEVEPSFLRVSSLGTPQTTPVPKQPNRRNSMEITREASFRYRAGSDASPPTFLTDDGVKNMERVTISASASFSAPITSSDLTSSTESIPVVSAFSDPDESFCSSIVYADDKKKLVLAASVDQLIYLLAGNIAPDKDFISQFLRTHHRFVDSKEFLQKLINRYNLPAAQNISEDEYIKRKKIVQVRIINVIKKWIELQLSDFQSDNSLLLMLQQFVKALLKTGGTEGIWASNLQIALLQSEGEQSNPTTANEEDKPPPKPILPKNMIARLMQFLDVNPQEMARQFTLMDSCALCNVRFDEYQHKNWCGDQKEKLAPHILEIIERFNKTSFWIASEIVKQPDLRLRVKILSKSIKLMRHLLEMGNMQGVMAVYSAVNITPIQRLGETWKLLPSKYQVILKTVGDLMSSSQNYKNYREHVRSAPRPFIPFQLIYLSDLTFISSPDISPLFLITFDAGYMEEAPDKLENGNINFKKMGLIGTLLNEIYQLQTIKHSFTPVPSIQEYITLSVTSALDEEQLYTISKTIEPRKEI